MKKGMILILMVLMTGVFFGATAQEILDEVAGNYEHLNDVKATISLSQKNDSGTQSGEFVFYIYKKDENMIYSIIRFLKPKEKKNITLLSKGFGETYMYLPALRSVKKMQASSEDEKFADSDFTYGELSLLYKISDVAKRATIVKQDSLVYVIEIKNDDRKLSYSAMRISITKDKMLPDQVTFLNWEDQEAKVIQISEYNEVNGKTVPWVITAIDNNTNGKTTISFEEIETDLGMDDSFFSPKNISRPKLKF